jgi:hypothetical protein
VIAGVGTAAYMVRAISRRNERAARKLRGGGVSTMGTAGGNRMHPDQSEAVDLTELAELLEDEDDEDEPNAD